MSLTVLNDMKIMYSQVEGQLSSINFMFKCGSITEKKGMIGMSHFLEHLILTDSRLKKLIDNGAVFNGQTEPHATTYYFTCASDNFLYLVNIFADIMMFKNFKVDRLQKEKDVVIQEIKICESDVNCSLVSKLKQFLFKNSLSYETVGLEKDINDITMDDVMQYYNKYYTKSSMVISVASNLEHGEIINCLQKSTINKLPVGKNYTNNRDPRHKTQISEKVKLSVPKAYFFIGVVIEKKDFYSVSVLLNILSGDLHARLYKKLRNRGYIYSIYSDISYYNNYGSLMISSSCDKDNLEKCLNIISNEFDNIKKSVKENEIKSAKQVLKGKLLVRLETTEGICEWTGKQYILNQDYNMNNYLKNIENVTLRDVLNVGKKYLNKNKICVITNE